MIYLLLGCSIHPRRERKMGLRIRIPRRELGMPQGPRIRIRVFAVSQT
jgi:hypothetical protein